MPDIEVNFPAQGPPGLTGATGTPGLPGDVGPQGASMAITWLAANYDVVGPSFGQVMIEQVLEGPVTAILLSETEHNGINVASAIQQLGGSTNPGVRGTLMVQQLNDTTNWLLVAVNDMPSETAPGKWRVPCSYINGSVYEFPQGYKVGLHFARVGDKGLDGAGGNMFGANNLSEVAQPKIARVELEISPRQVVGDGDQIIVGTSKLIAITADLTAQRTYTLPAASAFNSGESILVYDDTGGISPTFPAVIAAAGGDTINTGLASVTLSQRRSRLTLVSDGVAHWAYGTDLAGRFIGELIAYTGVILPPLCVWPDGRNIDRTVYRSLFEATTLRIVANTASGSPTIAGVAGHADMLAKLVPGMAIEGPNIPLGATISAYSSGAGTITLSANATASATGSVIRVLPFGQGNGTTTFGVCDARGRSVRGRSNLGGTDSARITSGNSGIDGKRLGVAGGDERQYAHTHTSPSGSSFIISAYGTTLQATGAQVWGVYGTTGPISSGISQAVAAQIGPTLILDHVLFAGV